MNLKHHAHPEIVFVRLQRWGVCVHDNVTKWKHFSALLALCAGNSPVTGEFSSQRPVTRSFAAFFNCAWINGWVNNREAGDLRRNRAHYDVTVMLLHHFGQPWNDRPISVAADVLVPYKRQAISNHSINVFVTVNATQTKYTNLSRLFHRHWINHKSDAIPMEQPGRKWT